MYSERGRRCRRSGDGDPPVCSAHAIAFAEAAKATGRKPGEAIADVIDTILTGGRLRKKQVKAAWNDVAEILKNAQPGGGPTFHPPPGWKPPAGWSVPRAEPPRDPRAVEAEREFRAAKLLLGFAESQPITADMVKERKKELARRYHPDRPGGSLEKMQEINAAVDVLLRAA